MVLEHLYRISLEHPAHWGMFFGIKWSTNVMIEGLSIERLDSYVLGLKAAEWQLGGEQGAAETTRFFEWLRARGEWPGEGWARKCLEDEGGGDEKAIRRFFGFVHQFVLDARPQWFVDFNAHPQPSSLQRGTGRPYAEDIRLPEHIEAARR